MDCHQFPDGHSWSSEDDLSSRATARLICCMGNMVNTTSAKRQHCSTIAVSTLAFSSVSGQHKVPPHKGGDNRHRWRQVLYHRKQHGSKEKHKSECFFYLGISMFDLPLNGPRHEFGQRKANHRRAGNWFCVATGHQRSLFKQSQTERLNDHADSSHTRCLVSLVFCGCSEKRRDVVVATSLCKLRRKEAHRSPFKIRLQYLFSHQT